MIRRIGKILKATGRLPMAGTNGIPSIIRTMLSKPPILLGEDPAEYKQLVDLVRKEVRPQQLQEWILMMDIVEAEWELLRLRGLKVGMLHAAIPRSVRSSHWT
jgi:hypothetical protein